MQKNTYFLLILLLLFLGSCKVGRFFIYNFADIEDYKKFPYRRIEKDSTTFYFPRAKIRDFPKTINRNSINVKLEDFLRENETVAFLVIKKDSILYEQYFDDYTAASIVPSFSMAKSFISILIGCAIDDELIKSVQEPVTNYLPELKKNGFDKVRIEHVLQMTSGLDFNEGYYNPFGEVASFYYGRNLRKAIFKLKLKQNPGKSFEYLSGNSQLLGLILQRALKGKTISRYFEEKIWKQIGTEYDATWSLDKENGLEKTFCCLNARARDFAKIGRLYLNNGNWNGKQIISKEWVEQSTKVDTSNGSVSRYQYQWWLPGKSGDFMARGLLGQFIYVNPNNAVIIVRLGRETAAVNWWTFLPQFGKMLK